VGYPVNPDKVDAMYEEAVARKQKEEA